MSTYIALTNQLLRRLNETEIGSSGWSSTRGVQSLAKDAIQAAIRKMNFVEFEWPFNAVETTQVLTIAQEEYAWPANFKTADWNSFQFQKDTTLNINFRRLQYIDRDEWYKQLRDNDYDSTTLGVAEPDFVFESHGSGFGVSPSPNAEYSVKYRYYKNPTTLVAATDEALIPEQYDDIIIQGGVFHMYMFRGNTEQAAAADDQFNRMLNNMASVLVHKIDKVRSTQIVWSGRYPQEFI